MRTQTLAKSGPSFEREFAFHKRTPSAGCCTEWGRGLRSAAATRFILDAFSVHFVPVLNIGGVGKAVA